MRDYLTYRYKKAVNRRFSAGIKVDNVKRHGTLKIKYNTKRGK